MDAQPITRQSLSLPQRRSDSHKGDYGRLMIVGGCVGYTGAPTLCARAAVRAGAGLVFLGVPREIYAITAVKNDEAMPFPLACDADGRLCEQAGDVLLDRLGDCSALVLGPGLGRSEALRRLVTRLLLEAPCPVVLDADGLWAVSGEPDVLGKTRRPVVITPHAGEFARLGGVFTGDRAQSAARFAQTYGCVTVLKGPGTAVAFPDGTTFVNTTGGPGMAKGGSGDVLSGVLGALIGQLTLQTAVCAAVWAHGRAGDLACARFGTYGMNPSDTIEFLPEAIASIVR